MNSNLKSRCDLLEKNLDLIHDAFKWDSSDMTMAGSSLYVGMDREADPARLKECERILKDRAGIFSGYRGNVKVPILCKMAMADDPDRYLEDIQAIVDLMNKTRWISGDYKVLAALTIYDHCRPDSYQEAIDKMAALYRSMKDDHPLLTSGEDLPFAAILAVSGMDEAALTGEMEACYKLLKERFHDRDAVQSLSHILALDKGETADKCSRVEKIWDLLKEKGHKYGSGYELAVLGTLCMLDLTTESIVEEIIEADDYLKGRKGFGAFDRGNKIRRMYAALMVMDTHMPPASLSHESLVDSMLAMVIAMEVCMIMMITFINVSTVINS